MSWCADFEFRGSAGLGGFGRAVGLLTAALPACAAMTEPEGDCGASLVESAARLLATCAVKSDAAAEAIATASGGVTAVVSDDSPCSKYLLPPT